jgi:hypothetical protein
MRESMTAKIDARIVLGGRIDNFKGNMPGIAEETLGMINARKPVFVLGGFGGCARDIAEDMGLLNGSSSTTVQWPGRSSFGRFSVKDLNNGLTEQENQKLAITPHVDEAIMLILRGLFREVDGSRTIGP